MRRGAGNLDVDDGDFAIIPAYQLAQQPLPERRPGQRAFDDDVLTARETAHAQLVEECGRLLVDERGQLGRHDRVTIGKHLAEQVVVAAAAHQILDQVVLHHVGVQTAPAVVNDAELVNRAGLPGARHAGGEQCGSALAGTSGWRAR